MKKIIYLFLISFALAQCTKIDEQGVTPTNIIQNLPAEYIGGQTELMKFLNSTIKYPQPARENNIQGKVIAKFTVDAKGKVVNPVIVTAVHQLLDDEVIRVIKLLPDWKPAIKDGMPADSEFTLPVTFKLEGKTKNQDEKAIIIVENF